MSFLGNSGLPPLLELEDLRHGVEERGQEKVRCLPQTLLTSCNRICGKQFRKNFKKDRLEREVGGGIGMGNTCKSMADSCQCMAKNHYNIVK